MLPGFLQGHATAEMTDTPSSFKEAQTKPIWDRLMISLLK
jgi:hypothetical protein